MADEGSGSKESGGMSEDRLNRRVGPNPFRASSANWWPLLLLGWAAVAAYMIWYRWGAIQGFGLGDTDDNMRIMQVRALIDGQGWYDLRQYRLNPPYGADIHWSRLVDLPIAGIKLALAPLLGGRSAETVAVAAAPLLPMLVAMTALGVTVRRLVHPWAFLVAIALIACAGSARGMFAPLRIDHHGWQLALVAVGIAALADPKRLRGGILLGLATASSLAIGMEMLLYFALMGAFTGLRWLLDREQAPRLFGYGAALGGGCGLAFLIFTSEANRAPVCDALSPVWLSVMLAAGGMAVALGRLNPRAWTLRLALGAGAALALGAFFVLAWPDCLGRLERTPPELDALWLSRVREALPVWKHGARAAALIVTLPLAGLIGYALMVWRSRGERARLIAWIGIALPALLAASLLLWQTRAGPAAQLLAIPGATALAWTVMAWFRAQKSVLLRVLGVVLAFLIVSGLATGYVTRLFPERVSDFRRGVNVANGRCPTLSALAPVARQPRGTVLTFVDLGPRLIAVTPHDALAGPYHRNSQAILDVMRTWRGSEANAWATIRRYRVDYVLICPNLSESTIYQAEAPNGFYAQLKRGKVPAWLAPVPLPEGSPYRMWAVRPASD